MLSMIEGESFLQLPGSIIDIVPCYICRKKCRGSVAKNFSPNSGPIRIVFDPGNLLLNSDNPEDLLRRPDFTSIAITWLSRTSTKSTSAWPSRQ